jgi:hypothetical protein
VVPPAGTRRWGRYARWYGAVVGSVVDRVCEIKPPLAILGEGAPATRTSELCYNALFLEGVVQCSANGHLGARFGPRVAT